ncbi:MAG: nuclear transport factor 2 family protein [Candidatus ainarchaeum sp.]|nr:nuclear transport factor 2 family protein [Candidatus ainarchaeum sp.]
MTNKDNLLEEIREIVNRETKAWDTQDVNLLLSIFHPDFVWVWPKDNKSHDPLNWEIDLGKFDYKRWKMVYNDLFSNHILKHNKRKIIKIEISKEWNGAFAVVDIDTLWLHKNGQSNNWKGRVCKVYAKVGKEWKLTMHTGVLDYSLLK